MEFLFTHECNNAHELVKSWVVVKNSDHKNKKQDCNLLICRISQIYIVLIFFPIFERILAIAMQFIDLSSSSSSFFFNTKRSI
jgi:hypothetical protein